MSWIDTRKVQSERANLTILFDKYVPTCLDAMRTTFKTVTPIPDNTLVQVRFLFFIQPIKSISGCFLDYCVCRHICRVFKF